jgi:DNA mismatch repair protein MutL
MGKIKLLDHNLINLIAAGEVVERPASVLKELLENSIDAGSTQIKVYIEDGGLKLISVSDNGEGMNAEDAELAFTQHATSKLATAEDLHNIMTLGFRGEALASIRAVADIEVETKSIESDAVKLIVKAEEIDNKSSGKSTVGTTISVHELFGKVPARRKFLRSPSTEFNHLENVFLSVALTNLQVHFELYHQNKLIYRLPATAKFTERVHAIWGEKLATNLYAAEVEQNGIQVQLFLGSPDIARKDRTQQYLFVNNRAISDRTIQRALSESYLGFIHKDLQPVYFVFLHVPPSEVDVNVHPRKQEVRFHNGQQIFGLVHHAARSLLEKATKESLMSRVRESSTSFEMPKLASEPSWLKTPSTRPSAPSMPTLPTARKQNIARSMSFTQALLEKKTEADISTDAEMPPAEEVNTISSSTPVTQFFNTYIAYQQDDEVIFIDQHAAAEKILYEKLLDQANLSRSRQLLVPTIIELKPADKKTLLQLQGYLQTIGMVIEDFGGNSIQITHLPELVPDLIVDEFLQEAISMAGELNSSTSLISGSGELEVGDIKHELNLQHPAHHLIATLACHGAIRAGQRLRPAEMLQLISDLGKCKHPYNCPHGRPVSWILSRREIESAFKRII